jgi:hypothetical protein
VAGEIQAAANTAGLKVVGVFPLEVDNTADGETSEVRNGVYRFANSATYPITRSAIGTVCYVEDDQTVAGYASNLVPAGIVADVVTAGVWVDMSMAALAYARGLRNIVQVDKTAHYEVTTALAYEGRTYFSCATASTGTILTLPSAVAGMRVGAKRANASGGYDVFVQCAAGDKIEGSDGLSAAAKMAENTVDAISGIIWWQAVDATHWMLDRSSLPLDVGSWVKNDA